MRMETFIRKALGLKAHRVVLVEEDETGKQLVIHVDRREHRRLQCGECGCAVGQVAPTRRPLRRWRDLALREHIVELVYAPCRVRCPRCGLRVERVPWADKWQRVTHALARAVAALARELTWSAVAHHFRLNWKTIAAVVEGVVLWGLQHRRWDPLHVIGIDEVSRRKGQRYVTIVYDLSRGRVVWVGRDRDAATMERFFTWLGAGRARGGQTRWGVKWRV
jgi:transposase